MSLDLNYYEILDLPVPASRADAGSVTAAVIKKAYRAALLVHHPDKQYNTSPNEEVLDVDLILKAYNTLSDPELRCEYDLLLRKNGNSNRGTTSEVLDLDDLQIEEIMVNGEKSCEWFKSCRCGEQKGYKIIEQNLVDNGTSNEIIVQCIGCSLWIKVLYDSVEEEE